MYLHKEDKELLRDIIVTVSERSGMEASIVEKDYYVTLILRELVKRSPHVVFKGGTSLSKAYQVIERFSEDIDITFEEHLGEARRRKVKYNLLKPISEELDLPIDNWDRIQSDRDYNHYDFQYSSLIYPEENILRPYIKLETALMSCSYPTEEREIHSIIYDSLKDTDLTILQEYHLEPFSMKTQSLTRTFIDKLFAVCDYYLLEKAARNSRHLYDIYKLLPFIVMDDAFEELLHEVRVHRASLGKKIAPSASMDVDLREKAEEMTAGRFYQKDYEVSTRKLIHDDIPYEIAIQCYCELIHKLF